MSILKELPTSRNRYSTKRKRSIVEVDLQLRLRRSMNSDLSQTINLRYRDEDKKDGKDGGSEVDEESKKLQDALSSAIVKEKPNVKWADVAGLD